MPPRASVRLKEVPLTHEALQASIRAFGPFKPLLGWQGEDHPDGLGGAIVIGGNQRLETRHAMDAAGLFKDGPIQVELASGAVMEIDPEAIPCLTFPGSWAEAKLVALRDNAQEGEWDWDALPSYMADIRALFPDGDLSLTGFDPQTLRDLEDLASDPLVGLDRFNDRGQEQSDESDEEKKERQKKEKKDKADKKEEESGFLTRKGARVVIGNIRGKIPVATYERLAALVKDTSGRLDTTDLEPIMDDFVLRLEATTEPPKSRRRSAQKKEE